jgi:hypothetical protein
MHASCMRARQAGRPAGRVVGGASFVLPSLFPRHHLVITPLRFRLLSSFVFPISHFPFILLLGIYIVLSLVYQSLSSCSKVPRQHSTYLNMHPPLDRPHPDCQMAIDALRNCQKTRPTFKVRTRNLSGTISGPKPRFSSVLRLSIRF